MAQFRQISTRGRVVPLILATGAGLVLAQLAHSTIAATAMVATRTTVKVPASAVAGAAVQLTATVSPTPLGTPKTGVTFLDNGNTISPLRSSTTGRYAFSTSSLAVGVHSITAHFSGDANNLASDSAPAMITIGQAGTNAATMTFTASPGNSVQGGTPMSFNVTMTGKPGVANPTGSVTFKNGAATMSAGRALFNGAVSLPWPNGLPLGTNTISAIYSGDTNYAAQTQTLSVVVTPSPNDKFISHLYTDMIGQPDLNGQAYWVSQLDKGMPKAQVTFAFTQTPNYANAVIEQLYQNIMHRTGAGDPGANFWAGQLRGGQSPERIAASMTSSPEWYANFGQGNDDTWIAACYQALLGRSDAGDPGAAYWHDFLATGGPRWQMTLDFVSGPEWAQVTVRNMYTKFHLGTPDAGSLGYWSGQVLHGMRDDQLAAQLTASQQYFDWAQTH